MPVEHALHPHEPSKTREQREVQEHDEVTLGFVDELERLGLQATVLEAGHDSLPDGVKSFVAVERTSAPAEQTVRVYRGISPRDNGESVAHQVPSVLKKPLPTEGWGPIPALLERQEVFEASEDFAHDPSYANMMTMAQSAAMSQGDRRFVGTRINDIQLAMLRDPKTTLIDELRLQHVWGPAGSVTQDLSPFIATATTPEQAAGFGNTLMVLDVPMSRIGSSGEGTSTGDGTGSEILVTGAIEPEWITAVARFENDADKQQLARKIAELAPDLSDVTVDAKLAEESELHAKSAANRESDLEAINRDRIDMLLWTLGDDEEMLAAELEQAGIDTYKQALWHCAERYTSGLSRLYGRDMKVSFDRDETDPLVFKKDERGFMRLEMGSMLDTAAVQRLAERYHWEEQRRDVA